MLSESSALRPTYQLRERHLLRSGGIATGVSSVRVTSRRFRRVPLLLGESVSSKV